MKYIHGKGICHRDLKFENILIDERNHIKIIDFGFGIKSDKHKWLSMYCGTPSYMAPELVAWKEYSGYEVDIWALGVILYCLLAGYFPFRGDTEKILFRKISAGLF